MTDKKDQRERLEQLHGLLIEEFIGRIESGEAEPSLLNAARQLLKDNSVDAVVTDDSPLNRLSKMVLPFDNERDHTKQPSVSKDLLQN
jgi:hypothetical protein